MDKTTTTTVQTDKVAELMQKLQEIEKIRDRIVKELRSLIYSNSKR